MPYLTADSHGFFSMFQFAFVALCVIGMAVFLRRKKVDPLSVAFGSCLIYFMPGFFGWITFSYGAEVGETYDATMAPGAYVVMMMIIVSVTVTALLFDRVNIGPIIHAPFAKYTPAIFLVVVIGAGFVSLATVGPYYLCLDKNLMLAHIDRWYYYAAYALPLALVSAVAARQYWIAMFAAVLVFCDVYIGFRMTAAISLLGSAMLIGGWLFQGWRKAASVTAIILLSGASLFIINQFAYNLKYSSAGACEEKALSTGEMALWQIRKVTPKEQMRFFMSVVKKGDIFIDAIVQSEPFVTQSVLNETIRQEFRTGGRYLIDQILTGVPGGVTIFGLDLDGTPTFTELFQPNLFPGVEFGMANNPWAQAYASGGFLMVFVFAFGYSLVVAGLAWMFWETKGALRGVVAVFSAWVAFYFHRNDLLIEIGILKQVVYTFGASLTISWILHQASRLRWRYHRRELKTTR